MTPTPAASPTANEVTLAPTAVTVPTASWPGTSGYAAGPHSLLTVWMSEWHLGGWWCE